MASGAHESPEFMSKYMSAYIFLERGHSFHVFPLMASSQLQAIFATLDNLCVSM